MAIKKLRLELDSLMVESFEVNDAMSGQEGTVRGAQPENQVTAGSDDLFCISNAPCVPSDQGSCGGTCDFTCVGFNTCYEPCQSV